jgi:ureidoacrylate peracid hydrolase
MSDITLSKRYYPKTFEEKAAAAHTALILVDMQNEFCSPDGYVARQGWDIRPMQRLAMHLKSFVTAARRHIPIIHIRGQYEPAVMPPQMVERLHRLGIPPYCQPGTKGAEFYPGFEPAPADIVITKRTFSAFAHTELEHVLRNLRIETVIVAGTFTNVCVDSTVRDAYFRGFYVIIPEDLSACPDADVHRVTLTTLGHFFGEVVSSDKLLQTWARSDSARAS